MILAIFTNLEAKNAEIMYFLRTLLPNGVRKFYKNNSIITKPHPRTFQNANIYFDNIFICVIFPPTNFDSFALFKKCNFYPIFMVKNGILLEHSDFSPLW